MSAPRLRVDSTYYIVNKYIEGYLKETVPTVKREMKAFNPPFFQVGKMNFHIF